MIELSRKWLESELGVPVYTEEEGFPTSRPVLFVLDFCEEDDNMAVVPIVACTGKLYAHEKKCLMLMKKVQESAKIEKLGRWSVASTADATMGCEIKIWVNFEAFARQEPVKISEIVIKTENKGV